MTLYEFRAKAPQLDLIEMDPEPTTVVSEVEWTDEVKLLFARLGYEIEQ